MSVFTRRSFLGGVAGAGIALASSGTALGSNVADRVRRIGVVREDHRVIVNGSGFGGGITALRLARGRFEYDAAKDDAILRWPKDGDSVAQNGTIGPLVQKIAGPASVLNDTNATYPSTWHPLGGAAMGSVCDLEGRVHGQRGLYVLDGALLPGNSAGCNPSMTIAAVAERALDQLVAHDVGSII